MRKILYFITAAAVLLGALSCKTQQKAEENRRMNDEMSRRVLVEYNSPQDRLHIINAAESMGGKLQYDFNNIKVLTFEFKSYGKAKKAIKALGKTRGVKTAGPDRMINICPPHPEMEFLTVP